MIEFRTEAISDLSEYVEVASRYVAYSVFIPVTLPGGIGLSERTTHTPYEKDYDRVGDPLALPKTFDTHNWVQISAFRAGERVAGAVVARSTPGVKLLEEREELALLWDIRVVPSCQRRGVGRELLNAAEAWAFAHGCTEMKVESQNTNPSACQFYQRLGFRLTEFHYGAYPDFPREVQLIWRKAVVPAAVKQSP